MFRNKIKKIFPKIKDLNIFLQKFKDKTSRKQIFIFKHIKTKLFVLVTCILIASLGASTIITYLRTRTILISDVERNLQTLAIASAKENALWIDARKREIETLANVPLFTKGEREEIITYLVNESLRNNIYEIVFFADDRGLAITSNQGRTVDLGESEHFEIPVSTGETFISDPIYSRISGELNVVVSTPVIKDNEILGVVGGYIKIDEFIERINDIDTGESGYAYIIKEDGLYVCHEDTDLIMFYNPLTDLQTTEEMKNATNEILSSDFGVVTYTFRDEEYYAGYSEIEGMLWKLVVVRPSSELLQQLNSLTKSALYILVSVILISLFIVNLFSRKFVSPIRTLKDRLKVLAEKGGDLTQKIEVQSSDEIYDLADSVNSFLGYVRKIVSEIIVVSNNVENSSKKVSNSAHENSYTVNEIAKTISSMAEEANKQSFHSNTILNLVKNTEENVDKGYIELEKTINSIKSSNEVAHKGKSTMSDVIESFNIMNNLFDESFNSVQKLEDYSKEIETIITYIMGISRSTKLLALNAAVEAARAGEHGKGFAVLAQEIHKLSANTSVATTNTTNIIKAIQSQLTEVIENMEKNKDILKEQSNMVRKGERMLTEIVAQSEHTVNESQSMESVFGTIKENSTKVLDAVVEITSLIENSAAIAEEVAASTEQQAAIAQEFSDFSVELENLASRLKNMVKVFKV